MANLRTTEAEREFLGRNLRPDADISRLIADINTLEARVKSLERIRFIDDDEKKIATLQAENAKLREYALHLPECKTRHYCGDRRCTCGLDDLLNSNQGERT